MMPLIHHPNSPVQMNSNSLSISSFCLKFSFHQDSSWLKYTTKDSSSFKYTTNPLIFISMSARFSPSLIGYSSLQLISEEWGWVKQIIRISKISNKMSVNLVGRGQKVRERDGKSQHVNDWLGWKMMAMTVICNALDMSTWKQSYMTNDPQISLPVND